MVIHLLSSFDKYLPRLIYKQPSKLQRPPIFQSWGHNYYEFLSYSLLEMWKGNLSKSVLATVKSCFRTRVFQVSRAEVPSQRVIYRRKNLDAFFWSVCVLSWSVRTGLHEVFKNPRDVSKIWISLKSAEIWSFQDFLVILRFSARKGRLGMSLIKARVKYFEHKTFLDPVSS